MKNEPLSKKLSGFFKKISKEERETDVLINHLVKARWFLIAISESLSRVLRKIRCL